jgi:LPXTG-motif cell wall-anchored protein
MVGSTVLVLCPVAAHADTISISLNQVLRAAPGSVQTLAVRTVDASLVGLTCSGTYSGENNSSVHPGNDLIVSTGSAQVVLAGVEDFAGKDTTASQPIVLGPTVTVSIRLGSDGVASLGAHLELDCVAPAPTTEAPTTAAPTTVAVADTVAATTDTVAAGGPVPPPAAPGPSDAPVAVSPTSIVASAAPTGALPSTGPSNTTVILSIGALCVLTGTVLRVSRRRATRA